MAYDFGYNDSKGLREESPGLIERKALCGSLIKDNPMPEITAEQIDFLLERGVLLQGAAGTGKTNLMNLLLRVIDSRGEHKRIIFIFDPKGDYLKEHLKLYPREETYVIGSGEQYSHIVKYWNVFGEIMSEGPDGKLIYTEETAIDALEISVHSYDRMKSESQPIFTNMSEQILAMLLVYFARRYEKTDQRMLNNYEFIRFLKGLTGEKILAILKSEELRDMKNVLAKTEMYDYQSMIDYISGGKSGNQSQGVLSYLHALPQELFIGPFAKADPKREFSIRGIMESEKSAVVFLEYDLKRAETLSPIYAILIDQLLKYALGGRQDVRKECYVILDEWARIKTRLKHMEDALSMGRSQNLKVVCGLQNIKSLENVYGEAEAKSILAGFQTIVGFYVPDLDSRTFLSERSGRNYQNLSFTSHQKNENSQREGYCLEDWDIQKLKCGQAAVIMPGEEPFCYTFPKYEDWKKEKQKCLMNL